MGIREYVYKGIGKYSYCYKSWKQNLRFTSHISLLNTNIIEFYSNLRLYFRAVPGCRGI